MEDLKPLALWAQEQRMSYNRALNAAIKGDVPARRIEGRWFIDLTALRMAKRKKAPRAAKTAAAQ